MRNEKWFWIAYGIMWFSVAFAVSVGIYITHSANCLWALLIPWLISFKAE